MNADVKRAWLEALRSGEYQQTRGQLHNESGFCCLGVLCDLHRKAVGGEWTPTGMYIATFNDGELDVLPQTVQVWAGVNASNPKVGDRFLAILNDGHGEEADFVPPHTFTEIAALIEEHL